MKKKYLPLILILFCVLLIILIFMFGNYSANLTVDFHATSYSGAKKCQNCHQSNFDSWSKTFHKTMTQEANNLSIVGEFDGSNQTYWGITIRPIIITNNYYFEYYNPKTGEFLDRLQIKRTVGSRRYQQYLAQTKNTQGNYYRLELLWHIEDKRWVHLNGAFLGNDHQPFDNHTAIWNQNCIFCHNTGVNPNMTNYDELVQQTKMGNPLNLKVDSRFDSNVSDLGIACEACHSNGEKHIEYNQNPIRRYFLHFTDAQDKSIINPSQLSPKKSMDICGQCHGQRTPKNHQLARSWMENGPNYRPGELLQSSVNPVWKNSIINGSQSDVFKQRFWRDGTPRLSAYEYQGILQSACHIKGNITCTDCHSMHDGNPKGMIKDKFKSNAACASCHADLVKNTPKHTKHLERSDGSLCYNCHMPKTVYGIMTLHRSHKIESPNPNYEFNNDKPNACIACHIDQSKNWVINAMNINWPNKSKVTTKTYGDIIQSIYKLHSGDPVERAIAAKNMSSNNTSIDANQQLSLIPHLLFSMEDSYPAIRRFSFKSLKKILNTISGEFTELKAIDSSLKDYDFIAELSVRNNILIHTWTLYKNINKTKWPVPKKGFLLDSNYQMNVNALLELRSLSLSEEKVINIGE